VESKRQVKLPCLSFWDFDLYGPMEQIFYKACHRRVRLRFMRVWFWDFSRESGQLSLFHQPRPNEEKQTAVIRALDRVRKRHGEQIIGTGRKAQGAGHKA
jgi:hypothetical protein